MGEDDSEDEEADQHNAHVPDEIKVLHGLDKVMEGGAVVLTLKDQNILADGDLNEEIFYMIWQRLICLKIWKLESRSVGTRLIRLLRKRWESMMISSLTTLLQRRKYLCNMMI